MEDDILPEDQQETLEDIGSDWVQGGVSAVLASSDWTTQTLLDQLVRGNIDLNPIFQRRDAWKLPRKSQFIESLILGLPVPQLVLAERKDKRGAFIVIDGKQRLLTLRQFASDANGKFKQLKLQGLQIRNDLQGLTYEELQSRSELDQERTAFENQTIRTVVIRNWPNEDFLYTVFLRLNTGSLPLSSQELRQALHPGPFSLLINEYSTNSEVLKQIMGLVEPDFRMRDSELVIRYLAFENFISEYRGNLKPLLDMTVEHFNKTWIENEGIIHAQLHELEEAISTTVEIFGLENALRKWNGESFEHRINRAVFDVMVHYFSLEEIANSAKERKTEIVEAFKDLCVTDREFRSSIEGTTKSIEAIAIRLRKWGDRLSTILSMKIKIPTLKGKLIELY